MVEKLAVSIDNPSPKVGDTLTAIVTPADAVVTYSWTAGDTVVGTEEELKVTADMLGKKIKVKVTALNSDTATSPETAAVEYEKPELVTAVRKAANSFTATFDADAQDIVKVDDIEVISEDLTDVKKITGLDFSLDGTSAVVTVSTSFKDGVTYNVNYGDSTASFVASVGEVDKIEILTSEAEVNTPTKIVFALFDANGVDVTSAVKLDETCIVTFEGDYDNFNNKKASNTTVTMATSGGVCTVTVEYDKNDGKTDQIKASKDITCIAASEKKGTPYFKAAPADFNDTDECYRFYDPKNSTDTNVSVALDAEKLVHFYAQDSDGTAISYDSYEIESADETVATAVIEQATGKWASFRVTGNSKGIVLLTLTATKNGAETTYEIPVTVTEKAKPVKAKLVLDEATISNAWDENYVNGLEVTVLDATGAEADDALYSVADPVLKTTNKGIDADLRDDPFYAGALAEGIAGFQLLGYEYTAFAAEAGSYVIEAEVTDLTTGNVLTARNTVTVKELPKEAWVRTVHDDALDPELTMYAPTAWTDENDDGIDDNTGLSYAVWSKLGWLTSAKYAELEEESVATGAITNAAELDLAEGVAAVNPAAGADPLATAGKTIYYIAGEPDEPITTNAELLEAVLDELQGAEVVIKTATVTTAATAGDAAVVGEKSELTTEELEALLDDAPEYSAGVAGQDAYTAVYTYRASEGVKTSYTIKMTDSDKTLGYKNTTSTMTASLTATMNGLFAGYVRTNGQIGAGLVVANNTTRIINNDDIGANIGVMTYFGKNKIESDAGTTALYGVGQYGVPDYEGRWILEAGANDSELEEDFDTVNGVLGGENELNFFTAQKDQVTHDNDFAREGSYKVEFTYWMANSKKATTESAAFTVKNDLYVPGVTVKSQYLDSYDQEGWATAVISEVDLNNNDERTYSVINLVDKDGNTITDEKTPAKWAVVKEEGVNFFKPLDRTFKLS